MAVEVRSINHAVDDNRFGPEKVFRGDGGISIRREFPFQITGCRIHRIKCAVIIADVNRAVIDNRSGIDGAIGQELPFNAAVSGVQSVESFIKTADVKRRAVNGWPGPDFTVNLLGPL